jgi:multimeric flavodoxin WrbA
MKGDSHMKLLGVSCGKKNGNSEHLVKEALLGAKEVSGVEIELIRMHDLYIKPCTACELCVKDVAMGGPGNCLQKGDHLPFFLEKYEEADGLIFGFPMMWLSPPGMLRMINERMVGYDFNIVKNGGKRRVAGIMSVGGTDWVSLGLPLMRTFFQPAQAIIVDHLQVVYSPQPAHVLLKVDEMKRANKLGRNVAEAMFKPDNELKWMGDEPGMCPVCNTNAFMITGKGPVECAICGCKGTLKVEGDKISIDFFKDNVPHWGRKGMFEHAMDIGKQHEIYAKNLSTVEERRGRYKSFAITKPPALPEKFVPEVEKVIS